MGFGCPWRVGLGNPTEPLCQPRARLELAYRREQEGSQEAARGNVPTAARARESEDREPFAVRASALLTSLPLAPQVLVLA